MAETPTPEQIERLEGEIAMLRVKLQFMRDGILMLCAFAPPDVAARVKAELARCD